MGNESAVWIFVHNKVTISAFAGWFSAQTIKVIIGAVTERRFNFKWFVGTGGMPSSHAAGVTALATSVGFISGPETPLFVVTLMFAVVVICDAQGVRRATGRQAEILNKIMDDIYWGKRIQEDRLKELVGHTPFQVIMGSVIGLIVGFIVSFM